MEAIDDAGQVTMAKTNERCWINFDNRGHV